MSAQSHHCGPNQANVENISREESLINISKDPFNSDFFWSSNILLTGLGRHLLGLLGHDLELGLEALGPEGLGPALVILRVIFCFPLLILLLESYLYT